MIFYLSLNLSNIFIFLVSVKINSFTPLKMFYFVHFSKRCFKSSVGKSLKTVLELVFLPNNWSFKSSVVTLAILMIVELDGQVNFVTLLHIFRNHGQWFRISYRGQPPPFFAPSNSGVWYLQSSVCMGYYFPHECGSREAFQHHEVNPFQEFRLPLVWNYRGDEFRISFGCQESLQYAGKRYLHLRKSWAR